MIHQRLHTPLTWQGIHLLALDNLTNLFDYLFHIYLARVLLPGDFVMVQAVNGVMVLLVTVFAVMQPVVARYVTEGGGQDTVGSGRDSVGSGQYTVGSGRDTVGSGRDSVVGGLFRYYLGWSGVVGVGLVLGCWLVARPISLWLRVPGTAVYWLAAMLFLGVVRPVVTGVLQGQGRFVAFGLVRLVYALGRFLLAGLFLFLGMGAMGVVAAIPIGSLLALGLGLGYLGGQVWRPGPPLPARFRHGFGLSLAAFAAFAAYMSLQTSDLLWVNHLFTPAAAGQYASAVLLRRIVLLLPSAVLVWLYPQIVAQVQNGQTPDKLLAKAVGWVTAPALLLTLVYFVWGEWISQLTFAGAYALNGRLLGWMGVAMVGYGVVSVWLNLFLATRPWPFVGLLVGTAVLQLVLLTIQNSLLSVTAVFAITGWMVVLGGLLLYLFWLRPSIGEIGKSVQHKATN